MAIKSSEYEKFKAIQANNEAIATQDFAGLSRTDTGWMPKSAAANSILGGQPLLKAGGTGAKILDIASTEPKPKTPGQAILKAAGKWKPLNDHYAGLPAGGSGTASKASAVSASGSGTSNTPAVQTSGSTGTGGTAPITTPTVTPTAATTAPRVYNVGGRQMTLGEYIRSIGVDPAAAYRERVGAANAAYDRQRATYGAEAEALASQGLTHSGTSDYLDAQAYAAKQKEVSAAAADKNQQMTVLAGQHATYLQQEQAARQAQIQTALDRAAAMQLNEGNTVKYLMAMTGMTKSEAERYAQAGVAVTEEDTTQATTQEITKTYLTLVKSVKDGGMGLSTEAAREYLKGGTYSYDSALVDQAVDGIVGAYKQTEADQKADLQKATAETIDALFNDAYSGTEIQAALAKLGVNLAVDEEDGKVDFYAARDAITEAYNKGAITAADYQSLHRKNVDTSVEDARNKKSLGDLLQTAVDYSNDAGVQKYASEQIGNQITIKKDLNSKFYDAIDDMTKAGSTASFRLGTGGKTNHEVVFRLGGTGKSDISADKNSLYVDENGDLYAYDKYSKEGWKKVIAVESAAWLSKDQEKALLDALKNKFKKQ